MRELYSYHTSALGQEFLHVPVAQCEPEIEPDGVPDDVGWKLMACVGDGLHAPILPPPSTIGVTMPLKLVGHALRLKGNIYAGRFL
jgi:hypothetical protein